MRLKYDTLANWEAVKSTFKPLKGEVCLIEVPSGSDEVTQPPAILQKVGNGTDYFEDLPYASALAADVYAWAKEAKISVNTASGSTGDFITGITSDSNGITLTRGNVAIANVTGLVDRLNGIDDAIEDLTDELGTIDSKIDTHIADKENPHEVTKAQVGLGNVDNKSAATLKSDFTGNIEDENTGFAVGGDVYTALLDKVDKVTVTPYMENDIAILTADGGIKDSGRSIVDAVTGSGSDIPTGGAVARAISIVQADVDTKVASVSAGSTAITVEGTTEVEVGLKLDNTGNVQFSQGANGLKGSVTIPVAPIAGIADEEKVLSLDDEDKIKTTLTLAYDSTNKKIQLKGISGAVVADLDATNFIKDGMVNSVSFDPTTKKLTITFNTDAGKEPIEIDLSTLVDTYTAGDGIDITGNVISVEIDPDSEAFLTVEDAGVKLSGVQTAINTAKAEAIADAAEKYLGKDETAVNSSQLEGHAASYFATAANLTALDGRVEDIEDELGTYGDIVTHNASEFDAAGAADTAETNAKAYTDTEIGKLDYTDTAVEGQFVTAVSETDGKITVTRAAVPDATWRPVDVDGTQKLGSGTNTGDVNFKSTTGVQGITAQYNNGVEYKIANTAILQADSDDNITDLEGNTIIFDCGSATVNV